MRKPLTDEHGEVRELMTEDVSKMRALSEALPQSLQRAIGQRGAQRSPTKVKTSMRISSEVIHHFKAQGPGWQTRIDDALKQYIREHG